MSKSYDNSGIGGLILFNADGTATYFAKLDGVDVSRMRGVFSPDGASTLSNGTDSITLTRQPGKGALMGHGTVVLGGSSFAVSAFLNGKDGPTTLGIKPSNLPARVSCPW